MQKQGVLINLEKFEHKHRFPCQLCCQVSGDGLSLSWRLWPLRWMKLKNAVFNMPLLIGFKTFFNFYGSFWVLSSYHPSFPRWWSSQLLYLWLHRFWPQWWSVCKRRISFQPGLAQSQGCESPVVFSAGLTWAQLYNFVLPTAVVSSNQAAS